MIKEGKIGVKEATWLIVITSTSKVFYTSPSMLANIVGNTGWYLTIISCAVAIFLFVFVIKLLKMFEGKDLVEVYNVSLGHFTGFIFSLITGLFLLFLSVVYITEFHEVIRVYVFPLSPDWYVIGIFVICVFILSLKGLEAIARLSKLIIYVLLAGFVVILLMGTQNYNINNLFPILGHGFDKTLLHGIIRSSAYGEVIVLAVFAKSMHNTANIKKVGINSLLISGLIVAISIFAFTLTFPYHTAKNITSPMYEMSTLIDYGRFIQRVEPVFLFIWVISSLISGSVLFYSFVRIYCTVFKIMDKRPIIITGSIILFSSSFLHKDITTVIFGSVQITRKYGSIPVFIFPLIALIIASIREKGKRANAKIE